MKQVVIVSGRRSAAVEWLDRIERILALYNAEELVFQRSRTHGRESLTLQTAVDRVTFTPCAPTDRAGRGISADLVLTDLPAGDLPTSLLAAVAPSGRIVELEPLRWELEHIVRDLFGAELQKI